MASSCFDCGKHSVVGRSQQHQRGVAGKRWKKRAQATPRVFKPNLQKITVLVKGERKQLVLCTKCIKRRQKNTSDQALSV